MNTPRTVLVAGSSGFVGRRVVRALKARLPEAAVCGIGRSGGEGPLDAFLSVEVRAENLEEIGRYLSSGPVGRVEAVVNCLGALTNDRESAARDNVRATEVLIEAASGAAPPIALVHFGSAAEYAPLEPPQKTDESTPTRPTSAYGESKLAATNRVLEAGRAGLISGTVLRLSNPIGPYMPPTTLPGKVTEFIESAAENDILSLGDLSSYRDFVDVRDAADAAVLALLNPPAADAEVLNIGSGVARRTRDLVRGLLEAGARPGATFRESAEGSARSGAVGWQEMDASRAQEVLGWKPDTPWPETLRYTVHGS